MIKSPLGYPGGKSRAIEKISEYLPETFTHFREPFVGGGSVFIYLKEKFPQLKIWINDLNRELFLFWHFPQSDLSKLVSEVGHIKEHHKNGRLLFSELTSVDVNTLSDSDRAVRFFVLNRITFSGTVESGGFSLGAFHKRFTNSSIELLEKSEHILTADVKITNLDYSQLLHGDEKNVFIFLDPPYVKAEKPKLHGKRGDLHTVFDHIRLAKSLEKCPHKWLLTYEDALQNHEDFTWTTITEWELQYGMNNYKQTKADLSKELFISNNQVSLNEENRI
ncbi:DNA adenine methylase [Trichormus azollae]|jgi:DNA adenine methylase|uniref:site-specific DNA-methyltransferase (adenine-specific) n=1 Tax=Nostoc azollae (strain 0708) TaxID=551115 RepID=D7DZJ4_NOSA0|nr:DNA adenine methylase [Trichormus azollae]ADI62946.1 D12 class N6 adenine-specific DNA methyltransferase ['Nostoc azollae' 0708]